MHLHASDVRGISRLAITATLGVTDLVESMHDAITHPSWPPKTAGRTRGLTGFVYHSVRGVTEIVGGAIDLSLRPVVAALGAQESTPEREHAIAALNGVLGDHLAATANPLAIQMTLRPRAPQADAPATDKIAVLVHGLCMNDRQWQGEEHDHGAALARDLGFTPLYLHYNSGLHISTNGRLFADALERTLATWPLPVKELVIVAHSMGGLVARSACLAAAEASQQWPQHLRKIVFLGAPHHGAPLERGGNGLDLLLRATPYVAPFARLGRMRSAGITDLRYGYLLDEEWTGHDRFAFAQDKRRPLPLPENVACFAMAAVLAENAETCKARVLGDGLVPLASALGRHALPAYRLSFPEDHCWTGAHMNHLDLLHRPEVYAQLHRWLAT